MMKPQLNTRLFGLLIALLALTIGLVAQPALAQQTTPAPGQPVELTGEIEGMTLDSITINGQIILLSGAEIRTALQLRMQVRVEGWLLSDGRVEARQVTALGDDTAPSDFELTGLFTARQGNLIIVSGQIVDTTNAAFASPLELGQIVRVRAQRGDDGNWIANQVRYAGDDDNDNDNTNTNSNTNTNANDNSDDDDDRRIRMQNGEFELQGVLTQAGTNNIMLGGQPIDIAGAEIKTQLMVGTLIRAHVRVVNGQLIAREVEGPDDDDDDWTLFPVAPGCVPTQPAGWATYTIRPGDSLSRIAARAGLSVEELAGVNCIADARSIFAGSLLFVPRPLNADNNNQNFNSNFNSNDNGDDDNGHNNDNGFFNDNNDDDDNRRSDRGGRDNESDDD